MMRGLFDELFWEILKLFVRNLLTFWCFYGKIISENLEDFPRFSYGLYNKKELQNYGY